MKIRLRLGTTTLTATLEDNAAAREFASMLPLTLKLTDYAGTEKVSDLPKRIITKDGSGANPVAGDIAYFAPWGNLAIYYKKGVPHDDLIKLGRINSSLESLKRKEPLNVTIELVQEPEPQKGD